MVPVGWLYARWSLGGVYWLPWNDWAPTLLANFLSAAVPEELTYRSLILGALRRWGVRPLWAVLVVGFLFGPVHHNRYLWRGDLFILAVVTAFGLVAAWLTLRRGNVVGAVLGHAMMNFLIFLFIGGKVTSL